MTKAYDLLRKYETGEKARSEEWQRITSKIKEIVSGFDKYLNGDGRDSIAVVKLGLQDKIRIREIDVEQLQYEKDNAIYFSVIVSLKKASDIIAKESVEMSCVRYHAGFSITVEGAEQSIIVGGFQGDDTKIFEAMYVALEAKFFDPQS
ncbi:hypothetical protein ACWA6H_07010 [Pseudomonas bijieensis]